MRGGTFLVQVGRMSSINMTFYVREHQLAMDVRRAARIKKVLLIGVCFWHEVNYIKLN